MNFIMDPVIPKSLDGLVAGLTYKNYPLTIKYIIKENTFSPKQILINSSSINFVYEKNIYRQGGAVIDISQLESNLSKLNNDIVIVL